MEDVLTSNVFGLFRYVQPSTGLLPFLGMARAIDGSQPLRDLAEKPPPIEREDLYRFWPRFSETGLRPCEPDLLLRIDYPDGRRYRIVIEAKYRSGKSSEADDEDEGEDPASSADQLARQWSHLALLAAREEAAPFLVYLTAHVTCPKAEIQKSIDQTLLGSPPDRPTPSILFLSWRELLRLFTGNRNQVLVDLCRLMGRLNLRFYSGVHHPEFLAVTWKFVGGRRDESCSPLANSPVIWSFRP